MNPWLPQPHAWPPAPMQPPRANGLAIASMILGILSIPGCACWFVGLPCSILAVVFGGVALSKIRGNPHVYTGGGMAIAGLVCGSVALLMALVPILFDFALLGMSF